MEVDRFSLDGLVLFVECFKDEDDGDQHCKTLLGEASDVANQRTQVKGDHDQKQQRQPHANPETQLQIVDLLTPVIKTILTDGIIVIVVIVTSNNNDDINNNNINFREICVIFIPKTLGQC